MRIKKVSIVLIVLMLIIPFTNYVCATNRESIIEQGKDWISTGENQNAMFNTNTATSRFEEIAGLVTGIGIFIAVGVGIILGIKFMLSTAEGKAEVSKLLTPYIIGVVIVVGALTIWKLAIGTLDVF